MSTRESPAVKSRNDAFLDMLPKIRRHAEIHLHPLPPCRREEAVQQVVCIAFVAFCRLVEQGRAEVAFPTALAKYAVRQACDGRGVGQHLNVRDVSSAYAQRRKRFQLERLERYDAKRNVWKETLVEDRRAGPAEIAAMRIDFPAWLRTLCHRDRQIARMLAVGESTKAAAERFGVTSARISQIRRALKDSWERFHEQPSTPHNIQHCLVT